jgi:hypothetical protein
LEKMEAYFIINFGAQQMTNQQLATIHGISAQAVGRWSAERKRRAIIEAQSVVNPEVKKLIGELAGLCYAAELINVDATHILNELSKNSCGNSKNLNAYELQGAIAKLEELIYG